PGTMSPTLELRAMFLGAYWQSRKETREEVSQRLERFFRQISIIDESLSEWFLKRERRGEADALLRLASEDIATALTVNLRDIGGEIIAELGFSLGVWNRHASLSATLGAFSPFIENSVVLSHDKLSHEEIDHWRGLMDIAIAAFEPEHSVVTSMEILRRLNG